MKLVLDLKSGTHVRINSPDLKPISPTSNPNLTSAQLIDVSIISWCGGRGGGVQPDNDIAIIVTILSTISSFKVSKSLVSGCLKDYPELSSLWCGPHVPCLGRCRRIKDQANFEPVLPFPIKVGLMITFVGMTNDRVIILQCEGFESGKRTYR